MILEYSRLLVKNVGLWSRVTNYYGLCHTCTEPSQSTKNTIKKKEGKKILKNKEKIQLCIFPYSMQVKHMLTGSRSRMYMDT